MAGRSGASRFRIAAVLSLGQVGARGVLALYFILLIHRMSEREYGDFAYAMSWLAILIVLADGGVSRLLLRDVARARADHGREAAPLLGARSIWIAGTGVVAIAAALAGILRFDVSFMACLVAALALEAASLGLEAVGQAADSPWVVARAQLVGAVALAGWAVLLLLVDDVTPLLALAGIALASGIRFAAQAIHWRGRSGATFAWPGGRPALGVLRQALPYLLLGGLAALYYRLDIIILHVRRGGLDTAPYAAAYRIVDASLIAGAVLFTAVAPHLSRVIADDPGSVRSEWRHYLLRVAAGAALLSVTIFVLAEPLSRVVFGERYAESAGENLRLLAPGIAFMLVQMVNASVVLMGDTQRTVVRLTLVAVAINALLTWFLAGEYGARGASIATSATEVFTFTSFVFVVRAAYRPGGPGLRRAPAAGP